MRPLRFAAPAIFLSAATLVLAGCSFHITAAPTEGQGTAIRGVAYGGQQPIYQEKVYLMEANTSSYGGASKSLLQSAPNTTEDTNHNYYTLTDQFGQFSISNDYTCDANDQVYLLLLGGTTDGNLSDANSGIALMSILGQCPASSPYNFATTVPFLYVNEVTTAAAAYSFAGFAVDDLHVGAPFTYSNSSPDTLAQKGIANAFASFNNLVSVSTGVPCSKTPSTAGADCIASPGSIGAAPAATLYTIADILAYCVNSKGSDSNCSTLFGEIVNASGSTHPSDTANAAIYLAQNLGQTNNSDSTAVADLWGLINGQSPYPGYVTPAPADYSVALTYSAGSNSNFVSPQGVAIDAGGNAWVVNSGSYTILSPAGIPFPNTPFYGPNMGFITGGFGIAITNAGDAWISDQVLANVNLFDDTGTPQITHIDMHVNGLQDVALDQSGTLWLAIDSQNNVGEIVGTTPNEQPALPGCNSYGLAVDVSGNVWVPCAGGDGLSAYTTASGQTEQLGGIPDHLATIAIDGSGGFFIVDSTTNAIDYFADALSSVSFISISGNGLNSPHEIAVDGAGIGWATDTSGGIVAVTNSGSFLSPSGGYAAGSFAQANHIAIDGSGNVWVTDYVNSTLVELIGAAAPVVTPVVANLATPYGAHAINKP